MPNNSNQDHAVEQKLDRAIEVLEDLFILQAIKAGIDTKKVRKLVKVGMNRINRISSEMEK